MRHTLIGMLMILPLLVLLQATAHAHGVAEGDKGYIQEISGVHLLPFTYLGTNYTMRQAAGLIYGTGCSRRFCQSLIPLALITSAHRFVSRRMNSRN
jgi:hypothetical protein